MLDIQEQLLQFHYGRQPAILMFLDLSLVFDSIDHGSDLILLENVLRMSGWA